MNLAKAKEILDEGGLVGIPTETVYGLAANALDREAVTKIFKAKQRPLYNPLIVHVSDLGDIYSLAKNIPNEAFQLAQEFWPGPLTIVLPKKQSVPDVTTGNKDTVAIRMPDHKLTLELLEQLDYPLAAPSANKYKAISPTKAEHVKQAFGDDFPVIDGGQCSEGIESTIVGFEGDTAIIYRHGLITGEQIANCLNQAVTEYNSEKIIMPGQEKKHYSPRTHLIYTNDPEKVFIDHAVTKTAFIQFSDKEYDTHLVDHIVYLTKENGLREAAEKLYETLHELDNMDFGLIVAEEVPDEGIGKAIHDKLSRAQNF